VRGATAKAGPVRTCVGCRRRDASAALVRFNQNDGHVVLAGGRTVGRGAWLCPETDCFETAVRRRGFDRAFRAKVSVDDDLRGRFTDVCEQRKAVR